MAEFTIIARCSDGLIFFETHETSPQLSEYKSDARRILDRLPVLCVDGNVGAIDSSGRTFYYIIDEYGIVYMVLCERNVAKKTALAYLGIIQEAFHVEVKNRRGEDISIQIAKVDRPYDFQHFHRIVREKKKDFKDLDAVKGLNAINQNLGEAANLMRRNIADVVTRGQKLDDVVNTAEELKQKSEIFRKKAYQLNLQALWKKYGPIAIIAAVIIIFIVWRFIL